MSDYLTPYIKGEIILKKQKQIYFIGKTCVYKVK